MPFDLTSIWIPVGVIGLLGLYMVRQFIQERRDAREFVLAETAPAAAVPAPQAASAPEASAPADIPKKKTKLRWRTAWIWLPLLAGFFGEAYLSFIKPMMDSSGH